MTSPASTEGAPSETAITPVSGVIIDTAAPVQGIPSGTPLVEGATVGTEGSSTSTTVLVNDAVSSSTGTTVPGPPIATKSGLAGPAVAGVAVGCFLAGAVIAMIVTFFFFGWKRHRRHGYPSVDEHGHVGEPKLNAEKATVTSMISIPRESSAAIVENNLPQPVEDNVISGEFSKLKDRINGHVEYYYHPSVANEPKAIQNLSTIMGTDFPLSAMRFSALIRDAKKRPSVICLVIAWIIVSRIEFDCDPSVSFLPWQVTSCMHILPKNKNEDKTWGAFLSKWRTLTSALLKQTYGQPTIGDSDPRLENVRKALQDADALLRPYVDGSRDNTARLRNMEEIMKRAVRFAYILFSHPSSWEFDWQGTSDNIVVFPGLYQKTDETGSLLKTRKILREKEVAKL